MSGMVIPAVIGAMVVLACIIVTRLMSAWFDYTEARESAGSLAEQTKVLVKRDSTGAWVYHAAENPQYVSWGPFEDLIFQRNEPEKNR